MANLFDSSNYPTTEPYDFSAGDRVAWKRTDLGDDYSTSLYTLTYQARLEAAGMTVISLTATSSGNDYLIEVAAASTAVYAAGEYHWAAFITRNADSERVEIDSGTFTVKPNKATATSDPRTHTKKVLDAIENVIEGRATKDQESLSVEGMTLDRTPIPDLIVLYSKYKGIYVREQREERMRNGKSHSGKILTRF